ncbi:polymorphic toxin-type HINT domain-containing protein [Kibdelosporangium persicum]|uniref:polymorphic toxin-type HINT domain-containing protein n=1 Tax=Kibdelosporangium persicum TaxID=2698649 RepID=UPI0039EF3890
MAARLVFTGGAWLKASAEDALAGTEADVKEFVHIGLDNATESDDRASVSYIVDSTTSPAMRQAALTALNGTWSQVKQFLDIGQHEVRADEYRIKIAQLMNGAGPRVKAAANAALNDGGVQALRDFLKTGYDVAQEEDDRVTVAQMLSAGGPEVKAVAQAALSGPPSYLRDFLQTKVHTARQRDADTASHVANIDTYLAGAAMSAAEAKISAAKALEAAAIARGAAQEAAAWALAAEQSAQAAAQYATDARESATEAQRSADQAAQSARLAREAAAAAQQSAQAAAKSSAQAQASAEKARSYADAAYAAAEQARAAAIEAGKSAAQAAAEAAAAARRAAELQRQEQEQKRQQDDQRNQDLSSGGGPPPPGDDPDYDEEPLRSDEDVLRDAEGEEELANYRTALREQGKDIMDFVIDQGGQVFLDLVGWTDAKKCFTEGDIGACIWTLINALGPFKLIKAAVKLPEIGSAIFKIVRGIGPFRRAVQAARGTVDRLRAVIQDVFERIKFPCAPNSFTAETPVLLADGSRKPISEIRLGDRVLATDPHTGVTEGRPVVDLITGGGTKKLVTISVAGGQVRATDEHPFWVADPGEWKHAKEVKPNDRLRLPDGQYVTVTATHPWTDVRDVYNLTVDGIHTYYVLAGDSALLVHNSGGAKICAIGQAGEEAANIVKNTTKFLVNGRNRIPDEFNSTMHRISEVKNVRYQRYTRQLRDYVDLAKAQTPPYMFRLVVRVGNGTKLSKPLQREVDAGRIILSRLIP